MLWQYTKRDAVKNCFPLPNEIFSLGLSSGALAVYSYLLYCGDRKTYQCYPSCRSIGKAVHMSVNTVRKYVAELSGPCGGKMRRVLDTIMQRAGGS